MKDWWYTLALRERLALLTGTFAGAAMLLYAMAWRPAMLEQERLETRVAEQKALLGWMRGAAQQVTRLRNTGRESGGAGDGRSLLARVEDSARRLEIAEKLRRIEPDGGGSVRLVFEGVSFDSLMSWLATISEGGGITVTELGISRSESTEGKAAEGRVDAKLTLLGGAP